MDGYIVGGLNYTDSSSSCHVKCHVLTCRGNWQAIPQPVTRNRCMLLKNHTTNSAKHAPFQKERLAAACSKAGAVRFAGFDPTDGLDS